MELIKLATKLFLKNPQMRKCDLKFEQVQAGMAKLLPGYGNDFDIEGFANRLSKNGFRRHVESWVSGETNLPLSSKQIFDILGNENVVQFARLLRLDPSLAADALARVVPQMLDQQSENGVISTRVVTRNPFMKFLVRRLGAA